MTRQIQDDERAVWNAVVERFEAGEAFTIRRVARQHGVGHQRGRELVRTWSNRDAVAFGSSPATCWLTSEGAALDDPPQ